MGHSHSKAYYFLKYITVADIVDKNQQLKRIEYETTLRQALQALQQYKVQAAPVYSSALKADKGIIDVLDILYYFCSVIKGCEVSNKHDFIHNFFNNTTGNLVDFSRTNKVHTVKPTTNFEQIFRLFMSDDVRRVVVEDKINTYTYSHMISQTDIIKFLRYNLRDFVKNPKLPLTKFKMEKRAFIANPHQRAYEVFLQMRDAKCEHAIILDEKTAPIASVSASELLLITPENYHDLFLPILQFARKNVVEPLTVCPAHTTFKQMMDIFINNKLHAVFVLHNRETPGIITLRSILKYFNSAVEHHASDDSKFSKKRCAKIHERAEHNKAHALKNELIRKERFREILRVAKERHRVPPKPTVVVTPQPHQTTLPAQQTVVVTSAPVAETLPVAPHQNVAVTPQPPVMAPPVLPIVVAPNQPKQHVHKKHHHKDHCEQKPIVETEVNVQMK